MDPSTIALILIIIGALLLLAEALSPGAYMIVPGVVLVILGIIGYLYPDYVLTIYFPIIALAIAVPTSLVTIKGYMLLAKPAPPSTTISETLVGRTGTVTAETGPDSIRGKVSIGSEIWSATSDGKIAAGEKVIVESAEGVHVKVRRI